MSTVLIIGGGGSVAKLATPKFVDADFTVTSLVRNPDHKQKLLDVGSRDVLVRDLTEISRDEWSKLMEPFDVVVWTAGNGGKGGPEATAAIDRDGELAVIEALAGMKHPPLYLTVSFLGWDTASSEGSDSPSWAAYVEAKRAVGEELAQVNFPHLILAPATLTDEPAGEAIHVPEGEEPEKRTTSRELVARELVENAQAPKQRSGTYGFVDA